jgi:hypothetical protein
MAYYDALIAKWAQGTGTTAQKLAQINALTVPSGVPVRALLTPSQIINACVPADIASLSTAMVTLLTLLLAGSQIDASNGTTVRAGIVAIFAGKTTTLAQLAALVAPFDSPTMPWWQATVAQGGGGLNGPVNANDLAAAGLS